MQTNNNSDRRETLAQDRVLPFVDNTTADTGSGSPANQGQSVPPSATPLDARGDAASTGSSDERGGEFIADSASPSGDAEASSARRPARTATATTTTTTAEAPGDARCNLIVRGLPLDVGDAEVIRKFEAFGRVLSAKVMLRVSTGASRGFGFVLFATAAEAERAREALSGKPWDDARPEHTLHISESKHRGDQLSAESRVVYLRNVPAREQLDARLAGFGAVERRAVRPQPEPGLVTWVVTYATLEEARACVRGLHARTVRGAAPGAGEVAILAKLEEPQGLRDRRRRAVASVHSKPLVASAPAPPPTVTVTPRVVRPSPPPPAPAAPPRPQQPPYSAGAVPQQPPMMSGAGWMHSPGWGPSAALPANLAVVPPSPASTNSSPAARGAQRLVAAALTDTAAARASTTTIAGSSPTAPAATVPVTSRSTPACALRYTSQGGQHNQARC
eukprot:CAMPEP_0174831842 /NCGR_PEP_ID=MMETSP1114-20130205/3338_1 /TAXON_ID=312471 /ORGANISM="Neobodo designis, Strain CCAP 1951/1" /LENGTH=447 /DNA_ID=CAMNT_0016065689 /DNA_START=588 /DNA_END=1930 /DNA_ORIENTATION=-